MRWRRLLNICRERQAYEGEAAARLEAMVDQTHLASRRRSIQLSVHHPRISSGSHLPCIEPLAMWQALLGDLVGRRLPR